MDGWMDGQIGDGWMDGKSCYIGRKNIFCFCKFYGHKWTSYIKLLGNLVLILKKNNGNSPFHRLQTSSRANSTLYLADINVSFSGGNRAVYRQDTCVGTVTGNNVNVNITVENRPK